MMSASEGERELRIYRVAGRVQGVGFRWWTRRTAVGLGLVGRVRNEADGSVLVRAAGRPLALDELRSALEEGPSSARVASVRREAPGDDADHQASWTAFEIERG